MLSFFSFVLFVVMLFHVGAYCQTQQNQLDAEKKKEEEAAMRSKVGRTSKIFEGMSSPSGDESTA